jgi:indolepyruvate ferredoxin oxidoreductase, beta subunit
MNNQEVTSILLVGVGGQGMILASKILSQVAMQRGLDVKLSEIHGMAQRGGSVVTQVRMGPVVHSPLVEKGQADYIMASEQLEAWRWLPFLKEGGTVVLSTQTINPMPVIIGSQAYPQNIVERVRQAAGRAVAMDAFRMAVAANQPRAANVVLLGALLREMEVSEEEGLAALAAVIPERFLEENRQAFSSGYQYQDR